jgi:hypothetical protein
VDAAVAVIFNLAVSDYGMAYIDPDTGISCGVTQLTSSGGKYCGALSLSR